MNLDQITYFLWFWKLIQWVFSFSVQTIRRILWSDLPVLTQSQSIDTDFIHLLRFLYMCGDQGKLASVQEYDVAGIHLSSFQLEGF